MQYIYHCSAHSISASVAALLHLGVLEPDQLPAGQKTREIVGLVPKTKGIIHPVGIDEAQNAVHVLYRGKNPRILVKVLYGIAQVLGKGVDELILINTDLLPKEIGFWSKLGLLCNLSRIGGHYLSPHLEIRHTFFVLAGLVERQKRCFNRGYKGEGEG